MPEPRRTDRFDRALVFASAHHREQERKGSGIPYLSHLLSVAALVLELGGDQDEAIGGLLHDAVEDAPHGEEEATADRIERDFGPRVRAIVDQNSDSRVHPKPPWQARKEAYVAAIASKDTAAVRVSLADKLHNARSILVDLRIHGDALWEPFTATSDGMRWYLRALLEAFEARADDLGPRAAWGLDELRRTVDAIDTQAAAVR